MAERERREREEEKKKVPFETDAFRFPEEYRKAIEKVPELAAVKPFLHLSEIECPLHGKRMISVEAIPVSGEIVDREFLPGPILHLPVGTLFYCPAGHYATIEKGKIVPVQLHEAINKFLELREKVIKGVAPPPEVTPPPTPPPAPPRRREEEEERRMAGLPEIRIIWMRDPISGEDFPTFNAEVIQTLQGLFGFPAEYWYVSDTTRRMFLKMLPPEVYMRDAIRTRRVPPEMLRWLDECIRKLEEAKRERGLI